MAEPEKFARYLGDGVYADFDGYHITLAANDHRNVVIYLEPSVMSALKSYETWLVEQLQAKGETE